ncbi:L,D-transpeptidase [Caenimonas sedimenti]|nr:L,D-transpeptidase [Caenimonas sedimenti]
MVDWVLRHGDHGGRPFAVVDKRLARIYVFDGQGRLTGETAALLGQTWGDHTVPGVGERAQTGSVRPDERTTPAGRFDSMPGRNLKGEAVIWVDHASAFAIHRLRPDAAQRARQIRLATASPDDNRASLGCVIVSVRFYEDIIEPTLGRSRSVVYVLPETGPLRLPLRDESAV